MGCERMGRAGDCQCRTSPIDSCTTPTLSIMETPTWLADYADPAIRHLIAPLPLTSGNELRQTGDPGDQLRDLDAAFARIRAKHASDEYRAVEAEEIMIAQELRGDGRVHPRRPFARTRSAGLREPAGVQHVPQRSVAPLGAPAATSTSRTASRAHTTGGWSSSARRSAVAADLLRAARRLRTRRGDGRRGLGHGCRRAARRVGLPAGTFTQPHRARSGLGARARGGRSDRVPRRRHRRAHRPQLLPERAADPSRLPRRRRTSARSTTWASPGHRSRRSRP